MFVCRVEGFVYGGQCFSEDLEFADVDQLEVSLHSGEYYHQCGGTRSTHIVGQPQPY